MNPFLALNFAIVTAIVVGLFVTHNPLFILGLLMLQEMPMGVTREQYEAIRRQVYEEDEILNGEGDGEHSRSQAQPMGFTQDVK